MRTIFRATLLALTLIALAATAGAAEPLRLKVMTFNVRTMSIPDGRNNWYLRRSRVADVIARQQPDLFGLQEAFTAQAKYIARRMPGYEWFGPARDDGKNLGERCPIFYRRDRFELLAHGAFWLSETPGKPSRGWDAACNRLVTWGRFKDRATGREFVYLNTHFDHMGAKAQEMSAGFLLERVRALGPGAPVVVTGDFNVTDDEKPYAIITKELKDSRLLAAAPQGPAGTDRGFKPGDPVIKRIDYVFLTPGIAVASYRALDDTYGRDRRPSDHMPVVVELEL